MISSGWPCDPNYRCTISISDYEQQQRKTGKSSVNPSSNTVPCVSECICVFVCLCAVVLYRNETNAMIVFSDNVTTRTVYLLVILPMDLIHLFQWPRLLQLNVHQFVRMLCTYLLFGVIVSTDVAVVFFLFVTDVFIQAFFPPRIRSICAAMLLQFFHRLLCVSE